MTGILTTHTGSLPRPPELDQLWADHSRGREVDPGVLADAVDAATAEVIERQREIGLDIVNDGEQGRESFFTFVRDRFEGFGPELGEPRGFQDLFAFPTFVEKKLPEYMSDSTVSLARLPACTGPVRWLGPEALDEELLRARTTLGDTGPELFVTSPSPGIIAAAMTDRHYGSLSEYVDAMADGLANEYRRIIESGAVLQIDAPDLAMERHTLYADRPLEDFIGFADHVVKAINRAIEGLPADRIRLHVCWGNYDGPHCFDVGLSEISTVLSQATVGSLMLSQANPRHAHEVELLSSPDLAGFDVVVGVIDTTSNYVEHPEVVAGRLVGAAEAAGDPSRILAGTDCGFATAAGMSDVASELVWLKLRSLVEGAALASDRLGM